MRGRFGGAIRLEIVPCDAEARVDPDDVVQAKRDVTAKAADAELVEALDRLLGEIFAGQRPLRVFRQMKMYNDPTMNPYLYGKQGGAAPGTKAA